MVEQKEAEESQIIPVRTRQGIRAIRMRDLMYAEGRARVYFYYLEDGQVIESVTMRENFDQVMEPLFGDRRFVKASASFVVNMGYATLMSGKGFQMKDGRNVSISRKSYAQIKRDFIDFLLDRGHGPAV